MAIANLSRGIDAHQRDCAHLPIAQVEEWLFPSPAEPTLIRLMIVSTLGSRIRDQFHERHHEWMVGSLKNQQS